MSMINLLNGIVTDNQEIIYVENKESALQALILHKFTPGEIFIVGYKTENYSDKQPETDIIVAIGVEIGRGPDKYRIISERRVMVVTAVLPSLPDVSTIALNQRILARDKDDGKLYYLWRIRSQENGSIIFEKKEVVDKCTIIDASTNDIYICNPPELVSFYESLVKPGIENIIVDDYGNVSLEIGTKGEIYTDLNFINTEEKTYLKSKVFEDNFSASIYFEKYDKNGIKIDSVDPCEVTKTIFTLEAKYSGENVELDSSPGEGWIFDSKINSYQKTISGNKTVSSGDVICTYTKNGYTGIINLKSITSEVYKYFFILYSDISVPTIDEVSRTGKAYLVSNPKGNYTITPRKNLYTWFCFPVGMEPSGITQLGLNYIAKDINKLNGMTWKKVNLGAYSLYHSLNPGNGLEQDIVIL